MSGRFPRARTVAWCLGLSVLVPGLGLAADPPAIGFAPPLELLNQEAHDLISADFNGDGRTDIALIMFSTFGVGIFLGRGDGTFDTVPAALTSIRPIHITAADFNGDGRQDFAASTSVPAEVVIAFGNGDGSFAAGPAYGAGFVPYQLATGDFNGDTRPDLFLGGGGFGMAVFLNLGGGALGASIEVWPDQPPAAFGTYVAYDVADFDADGRDDIAVAGFDQVDFECSGDGINFWKSLGTGAFSKTHFSGLICSYALASGDWDRDGRRDVVVLDFRGLSVYRNLGGGAFAPPGLLSSSLEGDEVIVRDFNLDGILDVALPAAKQLVVAPGRADGTLAPATATTLPGRHVDSLGDDFDHDGPQDIALAVYESDAGDVNAVEVLLNNSVPPPSPIGEAAAGGAAPLVISGYDASSGDVAFSYTPACGATDHSIVYGSLEAPDRGTYLGRACGIGTSGAGVFNPGAGSVFFLIVGDNGTVEGSYGTNSSGVERPESFGLAACDRPQVLTTLCP